MSRAWLLILILAAGQCAAADAPRRWSLAAGGGWGAPLSPRGADSFATAHRATLGAPDARLMRHWGSWGLGLEGQNMAFQRQDAQGSVILSAAALALEWDYQYEEGATDHVYVLASLGYGSASADAPLVSRSWSAPAGGLALGYELPLFSRLSLMAEASCWGFMSPDGFDSLAAGTLRCLLRFSL